MSLPVAGVPTIACVPVVAGIRDVAVVPAAFVAYVPALNDLPAVANLSADN